MTQTVVNHIIVQNCFKNLTTCKKAKFYEHDKELISCTAVTKIVLFVPKVILGGGRQYMLPKETTDPEYPSNTGVRKDKINLIDEWLKNKTVKILI